MALGTKMQPEYEKPYLDGPEFAKPYQPCYDYRNMEDAGKYRGVGKAGKVGNMGSSMNMETMPESKVKTNVRRDHR